MAYDIGNSPMKLSLEAFVELRHFISRSLAQSESADPVDRTSDESFCCAGSWSEILQFLPPFISFSTIHNVVQLGRQSEKNNQPAESKVCHPSADPRSLSSR